MSAGLYRNIFAVYYWVLASTGVLELCIKEPRVIQEHFCCVLLSAGLYRNVGAMCYWALGHTGTSMLCIIEHWVVQKHLCCVLLSAGLYRNTSLYYWALGCTGTCVLCNTECWVVQEFWSCVLLSAGLHRNICCGFNTFISPGLWHQNSCLSRPIVSPLKGFFFLAPTLEGSVIFGLIQS